MSGDVRLYVLTARFTSRAVVFRRGPSQQVLLLGWNTSTDRFDERQWLKGRIYERRCDLSPDGDLLLYFAASYRPPYFSWSALSRPPWLTALALWPKGDGWGGGGHFETQNSIALNHRESEMALAEGFTLPQTFQVKPFGTYSGWGEDDPVWSSRLERDGWILVSAGEEASRHRNAKVWIEFNPPITWQKQHPLSPNQYTLQMTILGIKERNGPWYVVEHQVVTANGEPHNLGRSDWADWSPTGDLLFAKAASLYRVRYADGALAPPSHAEELIDLSLYTFTRRKSPSEAKQWPEP